MHGRALIEVKAPSHAREHAIGARSPREGGACLPQRSEDRHGGGLTQDVGYTQGKMTSLVSPSQAGPITTNIAYDGPLPISLGWSGPVAGQVSWTYNDRFLLETETIGALPETAVTYQYDNDGLVTKAGDLTIDRDPASGRVTSKTIGNIRERFQYNQYGELSRQTVELMAGSTVVETLYDVIYDDSGVNGSRDGMGRITKKTERIVQGDSPGSTARPLASRTYDYGYNADGRPWLESVAVDGSVVSSYGYDANGNRTTAELSWSQLGYDASFDVSLGDADTEYNDADQLLTYGDTTYEWNNFGQLASKTVTSTGETTFYEYDLYGNLLSVALPDGRTIEYDVDGAGRRVGRRVLDIQGTEVEYRGWIYRDTLRPIGEVDSVGNVVARYIYGDSDVVARWNAPDMIEVLDGAGSVAETFFLTKDQVGSVALVTNSAGEIVQRIEYDAFGRALLNTNPSLQPFGFAGGVQEFETGLIRFGARDYDPALGRWTARDPALFAAGQTNLYSYVEGDPLGFVDPEGQVAASAGAVGGGLMVLVEAAAAAGAALGNAAAAAAAAGAVGAAAAGAFAVGFAIGDAIAPATDPFWDWAFSKGGKNNVRDTGLQGVRDQDLQDLYDSATGKDKKRYEKELKGRRKRNKKKRNRDIGPWWDDKDDCE